uniref:Uncharacterized protein n=1 Tax=Sphaerodactylus townsendi TaxID=933632 RepID=A0ACB8FU95_9SAUR
MNSPCPPCPRNALDTPLANVLPRDCNGIRPGRAAPNVSIAATPLTGSPLPPYPEFVTILWNYFFADDFRCYLNSGREQEIQGSCASKGLSEVEPYISVVGCNICTNIWGTWSSFQNLHWNCPSSVPTSGAHGVHFRTYTGTVPPLKCLKQSSDHDETEFLFFSHPAPL